MFLRRRRGRKRRGFARFKKRGMKRVRPVRIGYRR